MAVDGDNAARAAFLLKKKIGLFTLIEAGGEQVFGGFPRERDTRN